MFTLNPLPPAIPADELDLLRRAEPAVIGHFRYAGFMSGEIRAHFPDVRIAGTAITARVPAMDGSIVHYAIGQARAGDVLVLDRCGDTGIAAIGGALAYAAKCIGLAGIIVDGVVTDLGELRQYGVPVWSKGATAVTVKSLGLGGEFCVPVTCGGVSVSPGDAILADENGVLVMPRADIEASARRAIQMSLDEKTTLARLAAGEKYPDVMGTSELIRKAMAA